MSWRVKELKDSLAILASPADIQLEYLKKLFGLATVIDPDDSINIYELAEQYEDIARAAQDMLKCGEINISHYDRVARIGHYLEELGTEAHDALWSAEALSSSVEWKEVRALAQECLRLLSQEVNGEVAGNGKIKSLN